jgi:hypothetical protein
MSIDAVRVLLRGDWRLICGSNEGNEKVLDGL